MKTFREFIAEDEGGGGMVSSVPANQTSPAIAGIDNNPPVGKKKKAVMTKKILKRTAPLTM